MYYIYHYKNVISVKTLVTIVSLIQCKPNTKLPQTKPVYLNMYKAVKIIFEGAINKRLILFQLN